MKKKPKVFLTRQLPPKAMEALAAASELSVNLNDRVLTRAELLDGVRDCDGLLCLLTDAIDAAVMDAAPRLKVIANYAVGYNNIDVAAATARGILVTNTPGVLTETTADLAWALLLAAARRIAEGDRLVRSGGWTGWAPLQLLGVDVHGATLGIVGMGRIGQAVARRAAGFDMKVLYADATPIDAALENQLKASYASLEQLLRESDFISLHVPLTDKTRHMIGRAQFALMKNTAVLINTSRGPVVDEAALVDALRERRIAAAGLDVYENEPQLAPGLADLDNVVLAPHLGSATTATRTRMGLMAVENVLAGCRGERPPNIVNPEALGPAVAARAAARHNRCASLREGD